MKKVVYYLARCELAGGEEIWDLARLVIADGEQAHESGFGPAHHVKRAVLPEGRRLARRDGVPFFVQEVQK